MHLDKHVKPNQLQNLDKHIKKHRNESVLGSKIAAGELTVRCRKQDIIPFLRFLRDDAQCRFRMLVDLTAVDHLAKEKRFDVVYHLLSLHHNLRIRVKAGVRDDDSIASCTDLFPAANWYERETYDMFGIPFEGHPDLRRILTDYGFQDFPLRKDFPVEGKVEVYYDEQEGRVAYKPVDLPQQWRHFDRVSPWQGMGQNAHLADESAANNPFDEAEFKEGAK